MRELDQAPSGHLRVTIERIAIVGHGRLGTAIAAALTDAGVDVDGPFGRCRAVGAGAAGPGGPEPRCPGPVGAPAAGPAVCSGRGDRRGRELRIPTGAPGRSLLRRERALNVLAPHEAFSLHPLMTVPVGASPERSGRRRRGRCRVDATGADAGPGDSRDVAGDAADRDRRGRSRRLPRGRLRSRPISSSPSKHAAELRRRDRGSVRESCWSRSSAPPSRTGSALGPPGRRLTGPVARGDEADDLSVSEPRSPSGCPELLELFDALRRRHSAGSRRRPGLAPWAVSIPRPCH